MCCLVSQMELLLDLVPTNNHFVTIPAKRAELSSRAASMRKAWLRITCYLIMFALSLDRAAIVNDKVCAIIKNKCCTQVGTSLFQHGSRGSREGAHLLEILPGLLWLDCVACRLFSSLGLWCRVDNVHRVTEGNAVSRGRVTQ